MGSNKGAPGTGIITLYPSLADYQRDNTGAATTSSFTQASPRPGFAVPDDELSRLEPVISGAQAEDMVIEVLEGGLPGLAEDSVHLGYRMADEATTIVRGWQPCNGAVGWEVIEWVTGSTANAYPDAATHPDSQQVLVAYGTSGGTSVKLSRYAPATATWSTLSSLSLTAYSTTVDAVALLALPTGRMLLLTYPNAIFRTDDTGSNWTLHGKPDLPATYGCPKLAYSDGEILFVAHSSGGTNLYQYASSSLGAQFTSVETINTFGDKLSVCTLPDGRIVVVYRRQSDTAICCRVIDSPWSPLSDAAVVVVREDPVGGHQDVVACADPDGVLWAYVTETTIDRNVYVLVSLDGGETWTEFEDASILVSGGNENLLLRAATSSCGQVHILHRWVTSGTTNDNSIASLVMGGWMDAQWLPPTGNSATLAGYGGFGEAFSGTTIPMDLPENLNWTLTGAGPSLVNGRVRINETASQAYYDRNISTDLEYLCVAGLRVASGGAAATRQSALTVAVANNVSEYRIDVRFLTTGFRLHDPNGSAGAGTDLQDVAYDCTTEFEIAVYNGGAGTSRVLYRRPYEATWTSAWSGSLTNDSTTPAAFGVISFGAINATSTSDTYWRFIFRRNLGRLGYRKTSGIEVAGRFISVDPVPLHPEVVTNSVVGRLSVLGGIGARNETYDVPAEYDYPVTAIYPQRSPSPAATWRSTSKTEQIIAWALPESQGELLGDVHPAVVICNANFRTAYLESYNGAAWVQMGEVDLGTGASSLTYTLTGSVLFGNGGTATRYLQENELAGGYAIIQDGGVDIARRIRANTAGIWPGSASTVRTRIFLEDVTGDEDTSGTCTLVWPSGLHVIWVSTLTARQLWRIRIPASQVGPDSYYEAGVIAPGVVRSLGATQDWGWSRESKPQVERRTTPYGTSFVREEGPPIVTLSVGWTSGLDLSELRNPSTASSPHYLGQATMLAAVAQDDVVWLLEGIQENMLSGEIPGALCLALPETSSTLTDPSLWLYGRLISSIATDHVVGTEGDGEIVRGGIITFESIN